VALVSRHDQATIAEIVNRILLGIEYSERQTVLEEAQEVLNRVVWYTERGSMVQRACNDTVHIITIEEEITNLEAKAFLRAK
jgi:hypothetical protein